MEYIYAALLLHKAGSKIDESKMKNVLEAAGITPDENRIKAVVAALENINIDQVIAKTAATPTPVVEKKEEKKAEKVEEKEAEAAAAAGLGALFG